MAVLLAGGALIAGILGQYILFDNQVRDIVASVSCQRSLSRNPVRKGISLQVTSRIAFHGSPRMHIIVEDLLPRETVLTEGNATITTKSDTTGQEFPLRYRIIPLIHGTLRFSGISVQARNLFFETTVQLRREADTGPALIVLPTGLFQAPETGSGEGTRDNRKVSVLSSVDIHSLREYQIGDDLRHVDWKTSAKFDKMYIRKYTAPISHPPLVIVDLPWCSASYPEKEFNRMISEVTGMVTHTLQTYQHISILFISGPNIVHLIRDEKNPARCIAELREWMHPAERPVHFYHMPDRTDLRFLVTNCEEAALEAKDPRIQGSLDLLRERYTGILQYQRNPAFAGQIARTLSQLLMTEAYLFTLGCGDTSHIRHVVRPLKNQQIRVNVRIIDDTRPDRSTRQDSFSVARGTSS